MKNVKKLLILSLLLVVLVMQTACSKKISTAIQDHYENYRYYYEDLANQTDGKNGVVTFTVKGDSLIMTVTLPIEVKSGQMDTYRKVLETAVNDSDDQYYTLLEKLQEDVPEATFVLKYADQAQKVIVKKEFK